MKIDLNADLGEGYANNAALLQLMSSASITCGLHADDAQTILSSVRGALKNGMMIDAHPSFSDRGNFGRSAMTLPAQTVYIRTLYQISTLVAIMRVEDGVMRHVRPHDMLYNQAAKDPRLADTVAEAVHTYDPSLVLVGSTGSELIRAGEHYGLVTHQEVFADRGYQADGSLMPRNQPGALVEDRGQALAQTLEMVRSGRVKSQSGTWASVTTQTVCIYGGGEHALAFTRHLCNAFDTCNTEIGA